MLLPLILGNLISTGFSKLIGLWSI